MNPTDPRLVAMAGLNQQVENLLLAFAVILMGIGVAVVAWQFICGFFKR